MNQEVNTSPELWYAVPLAATSNSERDHLMFSRAQLWAKNHGVPIILGKFNAQEQS